MIISALITVTLFVVTLLVAVLPNSAGFPPEVASSFSYVGSYIGIMDVIVPMSTVAQIITLVIFFELAVFAFKAVRWAFSFIPIVGGRG